MRGTATWLNVAVTFDQLPDLFCDVATGVDQVGNQPIVHVEDAFVLGPISHLVTLRQDSPDFGPQAKSVRQRLKTMYHFDRRNPCYLSAAKHSA